MSQAFEKCYLEGVSKRLEDISYHRIPLSWRIYAIIKWLLVSISVK